MLKISQKKNCITPIGEDFPCYLSGHAIRTDKATGILEDIYTNAMCLDIDGSKLLFVMVELIGLDRSFTDDIRNYVETKYEIPLNRIHIGFTHTHSAPQYSVVDVFGRNGANQHYVNYLKEKIIETIDACLSQEFIDVEAFATTICIDGLFGNRNGIDKIEDKNIHIIQFRNANNVKGILMNFTCHSTVLGPQNLKISADFAGYLARGLEKEYGVFPIVTVGAAGDMSNRHYRKGNDESELQRVGNLVLQQIQAKSNYEKIRIHSPIVEDYKFLQTYVPSYEKKKSQYDAIVTKLENAKTYDETKVYTSALAMAKKGLECKPFTLDLQCSYIDAGDLRYFVIPAELFSCFGLQIKKAMQKKHAFIYGYCNYNAGYLGNKEDCGASFETSASNIPCGVPEEITKEIIEMLEGKIK